jgi:hypothetical protein
METHDNSLVDRIEPHWLAAFATVLQQCKTLNSEVVCLLAETQSRAINIDLVELAALQAGLRPFSPTLLFEDVHVPGTASLMPDGVYFQAAKRWPHMFPNLSPTYMRSAQAAFDFTLCYLRSEQPMPGPPPGEAARGGGTPRVNRHMYPTKQIAVPEMRVMLEQTKALWFQAISEAGPDPSKESMLHTTATRAIRTCGGQSML